MFRLLIYLHFSSLRMVSFFVQILASDLLVLLELPCFDCSLWCCTSWLTNHACLITEKVRIQPGNEGGGRPGTMGY
ncbi:hypothetical protein DAI22_03g003700 [Oryza sativa Japonica Group]|nr:hypothetical protein DAI22_03g003700 [Oryza sativa Japonica Group]